MAFSKKLNLAPLRKVMNKIDDNGRHGRCGNWRMSLGGYNMGYEIYYREEPIGRVNYEDREYELYDDDFIPKNQIPEFLDAIDARRFKDIGYHEQDDEDDIVGEEVDIGWDLEAMRDDAARRSRERDARDKLDETKIVFNDREMRKKYAKHLISNAQRDDVISLDKYKELLSAFDQAKPGDRFDIPEMEKYLKGWFVQAYAESRRVNEARKQILWAVDVRNMNTAIHGLFYGPDKRQAQKFAKALAAIFSDYERGDLDDDGLQYAWEDLVVQFPDMAQMEEVNFRDFGPTSSGWKKGLEDDDYEYRIINSPAIDIYSESKRNQNMKFKKIVKEADDGEDNYASDHPRIYVGTYAKYNDGSIDGKWIDLSEYSTYEEFLEACYKLHEDEDDPEFMVQDYENFPERWYHEGGLPTEEEFNKINEYYLMDDSEKPAYEEYVDLGNGDDPDSFRDAYIGEFSDPEEFGEYAVQNWGMPQDRDSYFDYDSFGRDLTMDWHQGDPDETDAEGEPEDPDYYYDSDGYQQEAYGSDSEVGESYVDGIGGVEQLGKDTIDTYFDYDAYGRDLLIGDCTESNGYVFWNH